MREHMGLFRGKRADNGEWVVGVYMPAVDNDPPYIFRSPRYGMGYEVDPTTIGECISLRDKNGKLIFEGDVVRVHGDDLPHWIGDGEIRGVKYCDGAYTPFSEYDSDCGTYVLAGDCEIIGNVVDNPELLKGGEGA